MIFKDLLKKIKKGAAGVKARVENPHPYPSPRGGGQNAGAKARAKVKRGALVGLFAVLMACAAAFGSTFTGSTTAEAATNSSTYIILNSGSDTSVGTVYKNSMTALYRQLGGSSVTTYNQLLSKVNASSKTKFGKTYYALDNSQIRSNNAQSSGNNVRVKFAGQEWLVAYVSKVDRTTDGTSSANGHLVATLMLADTNGNKLRYSTYNVDTKKNWVSPSVLYSTSYIRYLLNGTAYATAQDSSSLTSTTIADNSSATDVEKNDSKLWINIGKNYSSYLIKPKYISWQETQNTIDLGCTYTLTNDSYGTPYGTTNIRHYNAMWPGGATAKTKYGDWKEDYVWLPSASEIWHSSSAVNTGLWNVNLDFRKATARYQTRSIDTCETHVSSGAYIQGRFSIKADGAHYSVPSTGATGSYANSAMAYRTCIHLDLSALQSKATSDNSATTVTPYWQSSQSSGITYVDSTHLRADYTGVSKTANAYQDSGSSYHSASSALTHSLSGTTRSVTATVAGNHYIRYSSNSGYYFSDGTGGTGGLYLYFKIYRAFLRYSCDSNSFDYDGSPHAPTITSIWATSGYNQSSSTVTIAAGSSCLPTASQFTYKYYGTKADGTAYASSSSPTTTKPTERGSYTMKIYITTSCNNYNNYGWGTSDSGTDSCDPDQVSDVTTWYMPYSFTIKKPSIAIPTWSDGTTTTKTTTYQGCDLSYTTKYSTTSLPTGVSYGTSGLVSYSGTTVKVNSAGTNKYIRYYLTDTASYEWSDGTTTDKYLYITVNKLSIPIPTWEPVSGSQKGGVTRVSGSYAYATYTGSQQYAETIEKYSGDGTYYDDSDYGEFLTVTLSTNLSNSGYRYYATTAATYTITYSLKDTANTYWSGNTTTNKYLYFVIEKAKTPVPYWYSGQSGVTINGTTATATYTGSAISFKAYEDATMSSPTLPTGVTRGDYDGDEQYRYVTVTNAGSYTISWTITNANYTWSDGTTGAKSLNITVNKKSVSAPTWEPVNNQNKGATSVSGSYAYATYTGSTQGAQTVAGYINNSTNASYVTVTYTTGMSINYGGTSNYYYFATAAGSYTITFALKDTSNYQWSDATTANKDLYFVINRAVLTVTWDPSGTATYTFSAGEQGPTIKSVETTGSSGAITPTVYYHGTKYTGATTTESWGSSTTQTAKPTAAGSYTATARLTTEQAKNYTFSSSYADPTKTNSGTTTTKAFTIAKAKITIPYWVTSTAYTISGTTATATYTGSFISFKAYEHKWASGATVPSGIEDGDWDDSDCIRWLYGTDAGTYTISWTPGSSAIWSDNTTGTKTLTITINKAKVTIPYWLPDTVYNSYTISGTTATVAYDDTEFSFFAYEQKWINAPTRPANVYDSGFYEDNMRELCVTEVGTYTISWTLSNSNCTWSDGTTAAKTLTIKITKATATIPYWISDSAYTISGTRATATYTGYNINFKACEYVYINDPTCSSGATKGEAVEPYPNTTRTIKAKNAGNYTISWTPGSNCVWSDGTTGTKYLYITINARSIATPYWDATQSWLTVSGTTATQTFDAGDYEYTYGYYDYFLRYNVTATNSDGAYYDFYEGEWDEIGSNPVGEFSIEADYACKVTIKFTLPDTTNFKWSDGTSASSAKYLYLENYWLVDKSELNGVNGFDEDLVIEGNNISSTYIGNDWNADYDGAIIIYPPGWGDYGPEYKVTTLKGSSWYNRGDESIRFVPTDADVYTITFSLADMGSCDPAYCKWEDGTTADIVITWTYNRAVITLTFSGSKNYTYNGLEQGVYVSSTTSNGAELSADKLERCYDGTSYLSGAWGNKTTTKTKPVEAGEYKAYAWLPSAYAKNYTLNPDYASPTYSDSTVANSGKSSSFTINRKNVSSGVSWSEISGLIYDNTAKTPEPVVVAVGANAVTSTKAQFTYAYENNVNAGENTATVTITGVDAGNYTGECTLSFSIAKAVLSSVSWINTSLTYTGEEQGPEISGITLATSSSAASGLVSTGMFEITGRQTDAGTHTATATLTEEYAKNFATSASDSASKTFTVSYTIKKALITFTYGETTLTYTGEGRIPGFTLTFPDTVIESARATTDDFRLTVTAQTGSHLTDGEAIDAGGYLATATLLKEYSKNFTLSASSQSVSSKETEYSIVKAQIEINWDWTGERSYNGLKQGPVVESFDKPEHGADAFEGLIITYKQSGTTLTGAPVHVGEYTVTATITNANYKLGDGTMTETIGFEITAVSYEETLGLVAGEVMWESYEDLIFTGEAQGAELPELTGLFADADDARVLNVKVTYYQNGKALAGVPVYAGTYVAKAEESYGDYLFADVTFVIAKREVTLTWTGDEKSKTDGDKYVWLYDGEEHAPGYEINFGTVVYVDEDGEEYEEPVAIYRNGESIDTLKLSYTTGKAVGEYTATAALAADKSADGVDYNGNFIFKETYVKAYAIEKFIAERVDWYEKDSATALTESEKAGLSYEYTRVYGRDPGLFTAVASATFEADEGAIEITIPLRVIYPDYSEGYWWDGSERAEPYEAYAAYGTGDGANCGFAEELTGEDLYGITRVFITFKVTDIRSDLIKVTVTWVVRIGMNQYTAGELEAYLETLSAEQATKLGVKVVNGIFVFTYDGTSHSPMPIAVDEAGYHVTLHVSETSVKTNAGKYVAYLMPCSAYEISESESECAYEIAKREIGLTWTGADTYEYDGQEHLRKASVTSGSMLAFDVVKVTTDGAEVGEHTLYARVTDAFGNVNENYEITENATSTLTITKKKVVLLDRYWHGDEDSTWATDASGKGYYIWTYDGAEHMPTAELPVNVYVDGVYTEVSLKLRILGGTSATGEHYAYAMLDGREEYNKNFVLVISETDGTPTVPTCKFEIVRITIVYIVWTRDGIAVAGNEDITFEYDGIAHKPGAIGRTSSGEEIELATWGEEINAGTYRAYVSDNYAFDGIERSREFIITPKKVSVTWSAGDYTDADGVYTYNGLEQHPNAIVGGGLTGADYYVTGYVNAGSHIAELVFTNKNYTYDEKSSNICDFVIEKQQVAIAWTATGNYTPEAAESGVLYWSYNGTLRGPDADAGDVAIIVTGKEIDAGRYVVTATLDGTVAENANYVLTNETKTYVITAYEISVGWTGNADGAFVWEYDGNEHAPTAKYLDWNNEEQPLNVTGARVSAGNGYIATAELPSGNYVFATYADGRSSGERTFDIRKKTITLINWYASDAEDAEQLTEAGYSYEYDGTAHVPAAYVDGLTGEIAKLIVTGARVSAGSGYIATAALRDASNYELGADVNRTYEFNVTEKTVWIKWIGVDGSNGFSWQYTGSLICPTAVLADENGKVIEADGAPISVTVTGGKISAGTYTAKAHDTFTNYTFATAAQGNSLTHTFTIEAASLSHSFVWTATVTPVNDGDYDVYTYKYTGKAQQPVATCDNADIAFAYSILDASNKPVTAIINAGEYTITVTPSDASYVIDNATVKVVIEQITVEAVWSNVLADGTVADLPYGVSLPAAYYTDVYGRTVALAISDNGDGTAQAAFGAKDNKYGNYVLKAGTEKQAFAISAKTTIDAEWDNDNGYWKEKGTSNPVTLATVASFVSAADSEVMPVSAAQGAVTSTLSAVTAQSAAQKTGAVAAETALEGSGTAIAALNPEKQQIKLEKKKLSAAAIVDER